MEIISRYLVFIGCCPSAVWERSPGVRDSGVMCTNVLWLPMSSPKKKGNSFSKKQSAGGKAAVSRHLRSFLKMQIPWLHRQIFPVGGSGWGPGVCSSVGPRMTAVGSHTLRTVGLRSVVLRLFFLLPFLSEIPLLTVISILMK